MSDLLTKEMERQETEVVETKITKGPGITVDKAGKIRFPPSSISLAVNTQLYTTGAHMDSRYSLYCRLPSNKVQHSQRECPTCA